MICFRCGHQLAETAETCTNCGQVLGATRKVTRTVTSFRALDLRRQRVQSMDELDGYAVGDAVDGRYEIIDVVGRGPLGTVYRATETETGLTVALKTLHASIATAEEDGEVFADAFTRIGRHDSPDVLRVVPIRDGGRLLARSRFIEGLNLRNAVDLRRKSGQRFELHEVGPRIFQLVRALEHLHPTAPHGFLKPENILLTPEGIRISDFGLLQGLNSQRFIEAQRDAGAFIYLAPEVCKGTSVDARSDVYSIGSILFELLTGQPFQAGSSRLGDAVGEPGANRWRETEALIAQATAPAPDDRFQSITEFGDAFAVTMEAQALILSGRSGGGATTVRVALAKVEGQSLSSSKAFDREETESHAPVMVDPSLLQEHEASFDEKPTGQVLSTDDDDDVTDTTGVFEVDDEDIFDDLVPTEVERAQKSGNEERTVIGSVATGPWFLRSNLGFLMAVGLILAVVAGTIYSYIWMKKGEVAVGEQPVVVRLPTERPGALGDAKTANVSNKADSQRTGESPGAAPDAPASGAITKTAAVSATAPENKAPMNTARAAAAAAQKAVTAKPTVPTAKPVPEPPVTPVSKPAASPIVTPKSGTLAKPVPKPAPKPVAKPAPKPVAKPAPKPVAKPAPKPAPKPIAKSVSKPVVKATPPPPVKPTSKPAPVATRSTVPKPVRTRAVAPAARPLPKPTPKPAVSKGARAAVAAQPAAPLKASAGEAKLAADGSLSCPRGMRIVTTARFPSRSIRRARIKGDKAIAMARSGKAYCIDIYEYPGKGSVPQTRINYAAAKSLCQRAGKRLCTDKEWVRGCKGKRGTIFPYGRSFRGGVCNTETADGDEGSLKPSGRFRKCRSRWSLYDMSGNVAEWTADKTVRGGDFTASDEDAACNAGGRRSPASASGAIGVRCCKSF